MDNDATTLMRADYEALVDARDHAQAMRGVATGAMETLSDAELDAYLAARSSLAFWRKHRSLTQAALATAAGTTQPHLAQIEGGLRSCDVALFATFARVLRVRIEDLAPVQPATKEAVCFNLRCINGSLVRTQRRPPFLSRRSPNHGP